ncbi:MAG: DUF6088 family protein [Pseudobdellovibrionaceae bacterium]
MSQHIEIYILYRIYGYGRGTCFTPDRFLDLGSDTAIRQGLSRLTKDGHIRRLFKGLYEYPKKHKELGLIPASIEAVVKAIAKRDNIAIQPSGAYAANLLGLSEQIPARVIYLTNGSSRKMKIGTQTLVFKKTANKSMAVAGTTSGLVFEAFKYIGKENITDQMVMGLRKKLSTKDRNQLLANLKYSPIWMRPTVKQLAAKK